MKKRDMNSGEKPGKIIAISGVSGVGKTTLLEHLLQMTGTTLIESLTTRRGRGRDRPGEFRTITSSEFKRNKAEGKFLWTADVHGEQYGTPKSSVDQAFEDRELSLMVIKFNCAATLLDYASGIGCVGNILPIYVLSPGEEIIRKRLLARGDDPRDVEKRIAECKTWDKEAAKLKYRFRFLTNRHGKHAFLLASVESMLREGIV